MIDLSERVALVTGSSKGIGRECALRLAESGADVIVNYVTSRSAAEEVADQVQKLGRRAAVVKADVSETDDVSSMVDFIQDAFGRIDILVSNAATGGFRPLLETTEKQFEVAMKTNVLSLVSLVRAALPLLKRGEGRAKVIGLSSHGSHRARALYGLVGSTKAALESMTRHLALELGGQGINFNLIRAGLVFTDSTRRLPNYEDVAAAAKSKSLVGGRPLEGRDVADAVLYLASPLSDMVQGQTLAVDGGTSIHI
jgi:enoyl-[acyl-carrier protein] reductase III